MERGLIAEYEQTIDSLLEDLNRENHALAVEIAALPEQIRGFGHVKEASLAKANLHSAKLPMAILYHATLDEADFRDARVGVVAAVWSLARVRRARRYAPSCWKLCGAIASALASSIFRSRAARTGARLALIARASSARPANAASV